MGGLFLGLGLDLVEEFIEFCFFFEAVAGLDVDCIYFVLPVLCCLFSGTFFGCRRFHYNVSATDQHGTFCVLDSVFQREADLWMVDFDVFC